MMHIFSFFTYVYFVYIFTFLHYYRGRTYYIKGITAVHQFKPFLARTTHLVILLENHWVLNPVSGNPLKHCFFFCG
jgi:hypothetical protein